MACKSCVRTGERLCGEDGIIRCMICGKCAADAELKRIREEENVKRG